MADWRGSSLQIVVAIIGSSLIATALTSLTSFIYTPSLDISVEVADYPYQHTFNYDSNLGRNVTYRVEDPYTTYRISLENNGNSPAKDVRLTMTYPDAKLINARQVFVNENLNLTNKTSDSSVVTLPRLSAGIKIAVENNISGRISNSTVDPINDFALNYPTPYAYQHREPFSITVTHDQGAKTFDPSPLTPLGIFVSLYFNLQTMKFYIPIILALLLFAIAFRHKRNSMSRSASNILKDIVTVERHLKDDNSRDILSFGKDGSENDKVPILSNYYDYKLIDNFYKALQERELKFSVDYLSSDADTINDELKEQNKKCFNLATFAHSNIDWKKFYKFDLILLIPAITLGSSFISLIVESVPTFLFIHTPNLFLPLFLITTFIGRSIATYFIMRWILHTTQGSNISNYAIPLLSKPVRFFLYCAAIMGISSTYILTLSLSSLFLIGYLSPEFLVNAFFPIFFILDIGRMSLLALVITRYRWPRKLKMKKFSNKTT